jgi:hypothetical protein
MYAVILAGGSGKRLWPLSRREAPEIVAGPALSGWSTLPEHLVFVCHGSWRWVAAGWPLANRRGADRFQATRTLQAVLQGQVGKERVCGE